MTTPSFLVMARSMSSVMLRGWLSRGAGRGVRGDDRGFAGSHHVIESLIGNVGYVDHHSQAVHFKDNLFAKISETVMVLDSWIGDVARGVGPFIGVGPTQSHVAHAQAVVVTQQVHVIFDGVSAFDSHERGQFFLLVRMFDVSHGERHHMRSGWRAACW